MAEIGIGGGVGGQALFELGIVGVDFSGTVVFVEIRFGDLELLLWDLFHLTFFSLMHFPGSRAGKSGLKSDSEAVNDVLDVHGFSVGYKAEFTYSGYFPWSELIHAAATVIFILIAAESYLRKRKNEEI